MATRSFKLMSGEQVIANVHREEDKSMFECKDPFLWGFMPSPEAGKLRLAMQPLVPGVDRIEVREEAIMFWIDPIPKDVEKNWMKVTSGIVTPGGPGEAGVTLA